ncbi:MFS-type transporter SLC18B1-like [Tropilaelaps mercedesae]|uniref:MFS-type transporter SLC18B1-like n=1 Tax=Tropilaelaps mercedesae TaxID=418985 RepID=A0A1V9X2R7_9ACAR|nr:MFS-type transporter SLC18B1-like [Tropilaelaps mercedesae]
MRNVKGFADDYKTYSMLAGVIQSAFFLGSLSGATGGGVLLQYFGYGWTTLIIVVIMALLTLAVAVTIISDRLCPSIGQMQIDLQMSEDVKLETGLRSNGVDSLHI